MERTPNKSLIGQISPTIQPWQLLKGKDLKDYKIILDFELKERIVYDKKESAKTNLSERAVEVGNTTLQ